MGRIAERFALALAAAACSASCLLCASPCPPAFATPPARAARSGPQVSSAAPARGTTLLATLKFTAHRYAWPGGPVSGRVPVTWYGSPSILPVIATRSGWVRVRLAQRPDGATAWLRARDVTLRTTTYRIVINLATTHLSLYEMDRKILSAPAGVGTPDDPTPTGHFFIAFDEPPPGPGYGPFVIFTSAHSRAIADWDSSGDASIGIHGPLGDDQQIGTTGARISHGCIRLHERDLLRLRRLPPGTPIDITSGTTRVRRPVP
jgi:lipoprotein-anchoring transpeptidase ErfK/SrfK